MGNCFTMPTSHSVSASSRCSSWRSNSLCSNLSCDSVAAISASATTSSAAVPAPPRRILPFSTVRELGSHYQLGQELGKGQFGVIRLCRCHASGTLYACKSISKLRTQDLPDILREIRVMQRLSVACSASDRVGASSHIVRLHQVIEDDSHVHLIMELCRGGELFHRIVKKKCYSEREAALLIKDLMQSVQFCHSMGVMHRDIKPENILFVEDSESSCIKLADFGLALEFCPGQKFADMAGSAYYIAPEVLEGEYSQEIDVWSAGVVLYVMLSGVPPFFGETDEDIFDAIRNGKLEFVGSSWETVSFLAKDLITGMLCADVKARLTPAQVLEHPWVLHHCKAAELDLQRHQESTDRSSSGAPCVDASSKMGVQLLASSECPSQLSFGNEMEPMKPKQEFTEHAPSLESYGDSLQTSALYTVSPSSADKQITQVLPMCKYMMTDGDTLLAALRAQVNETQLPQADRCAAELGLQGNGWSCVPLNVSKTEQIFALEAGKKRYLISFNIQKDGSWRMLGCHRSAFPSTWRLSRPAEALIYS